MRNKYYAKVFMSPADGGGAGGDAGGDNGGAPGDNNSGGNPGDNGGNDSGDGGDPPEAFYKTLPENWRNQVVDSLGGDDDAVKDKQLKQLNRFTDFNSMSKSFFEAQDKIRSGQIQTGLPENATDEQIKDFREANGVPETFEGYEAKLDEGLVLGESDQRIMGDVYKIAHENNISQETMSQLTNAMMVSRQTEQESMQAQDGVDMQTSTRMMKETWGADYEVNNAMVENLITKLPESVRDAFANARLGNGMAMFNSPEILSFFAETARVLDPAGTVVPNSTSQISDMKSEIASIRSKMGTDEYNKNPEMKARYNQLITAEERLMAK